VGGVLIIKWAEICKRTYCSRVTFVSLWRGKNEEKGGESPPLLAMGFLPLGQKNKVMKETGAVAMMHYG
jgi:hypothetical protein